MYLDNYLENNFKNDFKKQLIKELIILKRSNSKNAWYMKNVKKACYLLKDCVNSDMIKFDFKSYDIELLPW